ncbi:cation diffusion facilitator family transporter [Agromyces mangrovi Wang et al. 2018]|uniref:cation diffusion facilitator family transporter n=1 Tax=Agromyces mangrovi TaxID=1858653 RepID=UPI002572A95B|nr:cation diffusion facilitator family transporter [Agromyces mangrovi]BDZ63347.1 cation transporter [Agromyces mangrovi]
MGHDHDHARHANRTRLGIAIAIVASVLVLEVVGAWISGSLALLADAGHMLSDLIGLIIALVAVVVAGRPATDRQTYGYQRVEVFAALLNSVILLVIAASVTVEAVGRLLRADAAEPAGLPMLIVATVGLVANIAALLVLRAGAKSSINMRGAYLEVLGDTLGSIAVIVAAGVILLTGFGAADAIASLVIAALIVPRALLLLRDVMRVLSESAPAETSVAEIRDHIQRTAGVVDVHDVHVWAITSGSHVFTAHVVVEPELLAEGRASALLEELGGCLAEHFDVDHSTFQLEPAGHQERAQHP